MEYGRIAIALTDPLQGIRLAEKWSQSSELILGLICVRVTVPCDCEVKLRAIKLFSRLTSLQFVLLVCGFVCVRYLPRSLLLLLLLLLCLVLLWFLLYQTVHRLLDTAIQSLSILA
ncbi:unnamed protein product [Polarella glacialis]|uniref:Uncharacterized protein n=1 Tax=Polarella glacialis TaxID=89957 RepID=A0A813EY39_POLGL|nr:unnamed protein product [Polarella glacialis]